MDKTHVGINITGLVNPSTTSLIARVSRATLRRRSIKGELLVHFCGGSRFYAVEDCHKLKEEYARARNG